MATFSCILAPEIPWTEEPGGLQSMGCKESGMTEQLNNNNNKRDLRGHLISIQIRMPWRAF